MLDHVMVDAYGQSVPLMTLGQVVQQNARTLEVNVFDPSNNAQIMAALRDSTMELNPIDEGSSIKVPLPKVTAETRSAMVKTMSQASEKAKKAIRNVRRDAISDIKAADAMPEDDVFKLQKVVQEATEAHEKTIATLFDKKKEEVTSVGS